MYKSHYGEIHLEVSRALENIGVVYLNMKNDE